MVSSVQSRAFSLRGVLLLALAACAFSVSTVFAKYANQRYGIPGVEIVFVRFVVGLLVATSCMVYRGQSFRPRNPRLVLLRAATNTAAVLLFFTGIQYTTVTNANTLSMTYPLFVAVMAPLLNRERSRPRVYLFLVVTMVGAYLVISPEFRGVNLGDLSALLSGLVAGVAISSLREARKYDDTALILFYLMALGTPLCLVLMLPFFVLPSAGACGLMLLSAVCAVGGQFSLTAGYRHIDAARGAIVTAMRIPVAAVLGITLFADPLDARMALGAVLILGSLIGLGCRPSPAAVPEPAQSD